MNGARWRIVHTPYDVVSLGAWPEPDPQMDRQLHPTHLSASSFNETHPLPCHCLPPRQPHCKVPHAGIAATA